MLHNTRLAGCIFAIIFVVAVPLGLAELRTISRITRAVDDRVRTQLRQNVSPVIRQSSDRGIVAPNAQLARVKLIFKLTPEQARDLDVLLKQQQDPSSPNYHKWLPPEQFGDRFGLARSDIDKISAWLLSYGLSITEVTPARTSITFSGTAEQITAAFGTEFHQYVQSGRTYIANVGEPSVPAAFADVVASVRNLDTFRLAPRAVLHAGLSPAYTSSTTGRHFLSPADIAIIYNIGATYQSGITGHGQSIAVVGQTNVSLQDMRRFRQASGLPINDPQILLVPDSKDPGTVAEDLIEANLDLQWAGAIAPDAHLVYVNSGNGVLDALEYAVDHNVAPVISISYGSCEQNFSNSLSDSLFALARQASAQGQSIVAASGDRGATDCDAETQTATRGLSVDLPASIPYVTAIGGTRFDDSDQGHWASATNTSGASALSYIPELAWNDSQDSIRRGGNFAASGGGISRRFSKPDWQPGLGQATRRLVPDIAFAASAQHVGYLVCGQGGCTDGYRNHDGTLTVVGGTSAGAPVFAAMLALINQASGKRQGNVNPTLYTLADVAPHAFHDVITGDNRSPCKPGTSDCYSSSIGYEAAPGYDLVTGLGSVDFNALALAWSDLKSTGDFQLRGPETGLTVSEGAFTTATISLVAGGNFAGSATLDCAVSASLPGTLCSVAPTSLRSGESATLKVSVPQRSLRGSSSHPSVFWLSGTAFALAWIAIPIGATPRSRPTALLALLLATSLCFLSCGGADTSTAKNQSQAGQLSSGTITVRATSGSAVHELVLQVTIN